MRVGLKVPLANHCRLIPSFLEQLRKGLLVPVETVSVHVKAVQMAVFACLNHRTTGTTDRVRHQAAIEQHAVFRNAIEVGCLQQLQLVIVGTERLRGMVIRKDEEDVRAVSSLKRGSGQNGQGKEGLEYEAKHDRWERRSGL